MSCGTLKKLLGTTALTAPALIVLSMASPVYAQCVSSGGSTAVPTNGATVTCAMNGTSSSQIGNGTTSATVVIESGHVIDATALMPAIDLHTATVTLGDNAQIINGTTNIIQSANNAFVTLGVNASIDTSGGYAVVAYGDSIITLGSGASITGPIANYLIYTAGNGVLTLGDNANLTGLTYMLGTLDVDLGENATITGAGYPLFSLGDLSVTLGQNATISGTYSTVLSASNVTATLGQDAIIRATAGNSAVFAGYYGGAFNTTVVLGENAEIIASGNRAVQASQNVFATLGEGARIQAGGNNAIFNARSVTSAQNSEIISLGGTAINGTAGNDTLDISGLVQGVGTAIAFGNGTDSLTLRTGASITGIVNGGAGSDTVTLNGTGSVSNNFTNFENLVVNATSWTLSGTSTFGTTNINAGRFSNNGTITSSVLVNSGIFGGTGTTIGTVTNSAMVAPGNSIGTQTITGNFIQNAGGTLEIEFGPASADRLNVSGTATLNGALSLVEYTPGVTAGTTYTFLAAGGGIIGNFSSIQLPLFYTANVVIGANNATVTFSPLGYIGGARTTSEQAVASALDVASISDPSSVSGVTNILNGLDNLEEASNLFASQAVHIQSASILSGMAGIRQSSAAAMNRVAPISSVDKAYHPLLTINGLGVAGSEGLEEGHGAYWLKIAGGYGGADADTHARAMKYEGSGITGGYEKQFGEDLIVGLFVGFSTSDSEVDGLTDKGKVLSRQAGLYAGWNPNAWHLSGSLSTAWMDFENRRHTDLGEATADFDGVALHGTAEISYDVAFDDFVVSPLAAVEGMSAYTESYEETGAGALNMRVGHQFTNSVTTELGVKTSKKITIPETKISAPFSLTPSARVTWAHEFLDDSPEVHARFASAPLTSFTSEGPERSKDSMRVGLNLEASIPNTSSLQSYVEYNGDYASDAKDHSFTLGLKYNW